MPHNEMILNLRNNLDDSHDETCLKPEEDQLSPAVPMCQSIEQLLVMINQPNQTLLFLMDDLVPVPVEREDFSVTEKCHDFSEHSMEHCGITFQATNH